MFENPRKGWHGAYSISGRVTAEHFDEILRKEDILNKNDEKKLEIKDYFEPDPEINNIDFLYDNLGAFKVYHKEKKHFSESISKAINDRNIKNKNNNQKIPKTLLNSTSKKENVLIQNNIYNPKYDLVFSKTLTGINWNKMRGRRNPDVNINNNSNSNDKCHKLKEKNKNISLTSNNNWLLDMNNYTKRGEFIDLKDIRMRYDKPFKKEKYNKPNIIDINNIVSNYCNTKSSRISKRNNIKTYYYNGRNQGKNKNFDESKLNNIKKSKLKLKQSLSQKIKVPDFKKYLPRIYYEKFRLKKGFEKNNYLISLSLNYDLIREKNISDIKFNHKKNENKVKIFKGIKSTLLSDCYKYFDKYNNHYESKTPNIKLMSSRNNKFNTNNNNEKSNDYLRPSLSSFYKNSFNNIINLKLVNSIFFEKQGNKNIRNKLNKIKNNLTFNGKSYKELIKTNNINKFDGITLKSMKRKNKDIK